MARILLVDDDDALRDTVSQMLELDRHQVTEARDGKAALSMFQLGRYDLVLTDILMPSMDGTELIGAVRRMAPTLPIVAMSGGRRSLSPEFNLQTAALMGASRQLTKPFSRHDLQAAVGGALQSAPAS